MAAHLRREINAFIRSEGFHDRCAAVLHAPGAKAPKVISVRLPRTSAGRPPKGGVHIPVPPLVRAKLARAGKHASQKIKGPKDVREKLAQARKRMGTMKRTAAFLLESSREAKRIAQERALARLAGQQRREVQS